jgi:hypothetical protein
MDAGCIITHHDHGCIDKKVAGGQPSSHVYDFGQEGSWPKEANTT